MFRPALLILLTLSIVSPPHSCHAAAPPQPWSVGVARIDITPNYPIRLNGFGFRRTESEGVTQRIWAKALAIGNRDPAVLLTVDNLGVPASLVAELARRLGKHGVKPDRLAVTATHTHTAPMLTGVCPTIFGVPIPADHQKHIDRYTREFTDKLEKVALAALADRRPARLSWGIGSVGFAVNRRTRSVPVDHDLPLLVVRDLDGKPRAVYVNYACHCVTLSHNRISGDWAGYAQEAIEADHQGAIALVSIGCGADSNPSSGVTGAKIEVASVQGRQIAAEVKRLLRGYLAPVTGPLVCASKRLELPLAELPTKEQWQQRARGKNAIGHHARVQLERLAKGESLKTKIDYSVRTWAFGDSLAMVFLPGEVVVDYSLRLKRQLDGRRLWINAYSNDAPCYIPSERVLREGGYEGGGAMVYYDVPGPFKAGLEEKIVGAVTSQIGKKFASPIDPKKTHGSLPRSPQQSLAALRPRSGLTVDLVAAEPLVASPVAIDFGPDGRLWVAEMVDYPSGLRGGFEPGGRVRILEDTNEDGIFDKATIFLDNIPFPTGITVWRKGVLICAAPDILFAEDQSGDGKADLVRKLYSGFGTENYQGRVNSLCYGLDGWVYGSCGLFGGKITSHLTGKVLNLGNRDFRIRPDTGEIEPALGRTQQGLARDDWGNWFGCDNSTLCRHHVLADHYLRRNPHVAFRDVSVYVPDYPDSNRLYPARTEVQRFKLSGALGRVTSACGLGVYRDELLGRDFLGNVFVCEPVHLLVHRLRLSPRGSTFSGRRAEDEKESEFLAATDGWHRPVQVRTGPDGALWVVDMYRFVIEHPRWIPKEDLARLDVRAGSGMGRIYRIRRAGAPVRPWLRLDRLDTKGLVLALDSPNGTQRDLATQMLLWRKDTSAIEALENLAQSKRPEARLHALCVLDGLGKLTPKLVKTALADPHPGVRRHAIRLAERFLDHEAELGSALVKLAGDTDAQVRLQVAYSLGAWRDERAGKSLAALATAHADDPSLVAAVLSSLRREQIAEVLTGALARETPNSTLVQQLIGLAVAIGDHKALPTVLNRLCTSRNGRYAAWQLSGLASVLDALDRRKQSLDTIARGNLADQLRKMLAQLRATALDEKAAESDRLAVLAVLGRSADDLNVLGKLLSPRHSASIQSASLQALARRNDERIADLLLGRWKEFSPALQMRAVDLLLSRPRWQRQVLSALEKQTIPAGQIDAVRRQRLLSARDAQVRERANRVFATATSRDRQKVIDTYAAKLTSKGDAGRGKAVFARACAACHRLQGVGHEVGPDLAAQSGKSPGYWLTEIFDPNRNVDSRYTQYTAVTNRGQTFIGLLSTETATSITLRAQEGKEQVLLRHDLEELVSSGKSLMPEGLEKDLPQKEVNDLLAYLAEATQADAKALATQILDDKVPAARRQAIIAEHTKLAVELLSALVEGLKPNTPEEYRRIPWIWRVSIAAGKRNDAKEIVKLLEVSLPRLDEPLRDWQAVVIGGGIINGISLAGAWPGERLTALLKDRGELKKRWQKALEQASNMADREKTPTGTRYDALRMIALDSWEKAGKQLTKYLKKGTHPELTMGAISGLSDIDAAKIAPLLVGGLGHYSPNNRRLAVAALLRTEARTAVLLEALEKGTVKQEVLSKEQIRVLTEHKNKTLRERAQRVLKET